MTLVSEDTDGHDDSDGHDDKKMKKMKKMRKMKKVKKVKLGFRRNSCAPMSGKRMREKETPQIINQGEPILIGQPVPQMSNADL